MAKRGLLAMTGPAGQERGQKAAYGTGVVVVMM